jgi:hypothetical protein
VATPTSPCWSKIAPTPLYQTVIAKAPAGAAASFKVAWSGQTIYIRANVKQWPMYCNTSGNWYDCDAIEIYIGPNSELGATYGSHDRQLGVRAQGGAFETGTNGGGVTGETAASSIVTGTGYLAELTLPLSNVDVTAASGTVIGFSLAADMPLSGGAVHQSNNTVAQMMWAGTVNNWQSPKAWGAILLQ